jgi:hypothetical protein
VEFALFTLDFARLFGAAAHLGSDHLAEEEADLAFLSGHLAGAGRPDREVWLVGAPPARLLGTDLPDGRRGPPAAEADSRARASARARWGAAGGPSGDPAAVAWWERGIAYDLVRSTAGALAAGADRVFHGSRSSGDGADTLVAPDAEGWRRTPAAYALRQANRLLGGHVGVRKSVLGPATAWRFAFPPGHDPPWLLVLAADPDLSWAGRPGEDDDPREVAVPLSDGTYRIQETALGPGDPTSLVRRADGGALLVRLGPGPVWIVPEVPAR